MFLKNAGRQLTVAKRGIEWEKANYAIRYNSKTVTLITELQNEFSVF